MTKSQDMVPPFSVFWVAFVQATDPATDPNNMVGPGKLWVETDDDTTPTQVVGMHVWSVDDSAWLDFPIGSAGVVADSDYGDITVSGSGATWTIDNGVVTGAKIASSVALAGSPTTTTQSAADNSTKIATTAYVDSAVTAGAGAPTNADYLVKTANGSLSAERVVTDGTSITADWSVAGQVVLKRAALTGDVTASADSNATTIKNDVALAGNPTTTTQSSGNNTTRIATTAFVTDAVAKQKEVLGFAVSDETTALTTGTAKLTFRMPFAMTLTEVRANLNTVSSSGNPAIDINEGGVSIFSTTLTIDSGEKTSTTAATPAVISDASLADDAEMTVDIDTAGTGAKGLKIWLIGTRT